MRKGIISVSLETSAQPGSSFGVGAQLKFGKADPSHPIVGEDIARRQPERFVDVAFCLDSATKKTLCVTDVPVCQGEVSIQRQRSFAFRDALSCTLG
jgi:hypothetical protein